MPSQIPSSLPHGPSVYPGFTPTYIYYFKQSATIEQYYPTSALIGFGYHNSTTLKIFFRGAQDVNAKDEIRITVAAGTSLSDAAQWILNAPVYQHVNPTYRHILNVCITGAVPTSFRPEFLSCTITYGTCCSGAGSGTMSNWTLSDGGTTQLIENSETVLFAGSTYINNVVSAVNTVTTSLSASDGTSDATTRFLSKDNTWDVPTYTSAYVLPEATTTVRGGLELFSDVDQSVAATAVSTTGSRTYGLQLNADGQGVINVPWTDTTLTYTAGDGLDLSVGEFSTDLRANSGLQITSTELDLNLSASSITGTLDETDGGTGLTSYTTGDVLYASGSNTLAKLAVGSNTHVLTLAGGVPTWAAGGGGGDAFTTMVPISGTTPTAVGADALNFTSLQSGACAGIAGGTGGVAIDGNSGTDTLNILARKYESFVVTMTDEKRPIVTGDKYEFRIPYNFTIAWYGGVVDDAERCCAPVKIMVNTPPTGDGAALDVDVQTSTNNRVSFATIFDVRPTIDANEWSSVTGTTCMQLISNAASLGISCDTVLKFTVVTAVGNPVGLKCTILGYQTTIV